MICCCNICNLILCTLRIILPAVFIIFSFRETRLLGMTADLFFPEEQHHKIVLPIGDSLHTTLQLW